jgi:arginine/lysine/ornithine decarboxylase
MLAIIKKNMPKGKRTRILAARNAHKAFIHACALLDIDAEWLYPDNFTHLCACSVSPAALEKAICASLPDAVYITSPDYLGNLCDVKAFADVCHAHGIPLLVDNAHGAYQAFLKPSRHPIALGADMCCDSAHKTLPVLTGGAYLHVSKNYDAPATKEIRNTISLFASTSPSYLILQSLDLCNSYLAEQFPTQLDACVKRAEKLRKELCSLGISPLENTEELKIVFSKDKCGYSGDELADILRKKGIEVEFSDRDMLVLMLSPMIEERDYERLLSVLSSLPKRSASKRILPKPTRPKQIISIREATFSKSELVSAQNSLGRICAAPTVACPPAVPIVVSGELIDENAVELLRYYGIEHIEVVK